MTQYIKFTLTPGQMAPEGNTGVALSDGYLVWAGVSGTFDDHAYFGRLTPQDPAPDRDITYELMTDEEISEYNTIITASGVE